MQVIIDLPEVTLQKVRWHGLYLCPRDRQILEDAIKNAVSVVRCKDCKHFFAPCDSKHGSCDKLGHGCSAEEYCSDGERKEE